MTIGSNARNNIKAFFTPDELAGFLAISKSTVYRLVNKRQLPFHKIGGVLRFRRDDIERYLDTERIEPIKL
jgi:excisionase family DNA binding protein